MWNLLQTQNMCVPQHQGCPFCDPWFVTLVTTRPHEVWRDETSQAEDVAQKKDVVVEYGIVAGEEEAAEVEASVVEVEEEQGEVGHLVMMNTSLEFICKS